MSVSKILGLVGVLAASPAYAGTLLNGDMESWPGTCAVNRPPTSWTNFHAGSPVTGSDQGGQCIGPDAFDGVSFMNLVWTPNFQEGSQFQFTDLVPGLEYEVTFYGRNSNGTYAATGTSSIELYHNGNVILSTSELPAPGMWQAYSQTFTAASATDTIGFRVGVGTGASGSAGVDAVSITAFVPCPDGDGDGQCDGVDPCPLDPADDADGDGFCADADDDGLCNDRDFLLDVTSVRAGQPMSFRVLRAPPGANVTFYVSMQGLGDAPCVPGTTMCGSLRSPIPVGQEVVGNNGVATLTLNVPPTVQPGQRLLFQALADGPTADLTQAVIRHARP
jgi:hypothetical protein